MAELGGSVDELQLDLLQGRTAGLGQQTATQGDGTLLGTRHLDGATDKQQQKDVVRYGMACNAGPHGSWAIPLFWWWCRLPTSPKKRYGIERIGYAQ